MKRKKVQEHSRIVLIDGKSLSLERAEAIADGAVLRLAPSVRQHVESSYELTKELAKEMKPHYGLNTGIGRLAHKRLPHGDLVKLQQHILESHAAGYGEPLTIPETRLAMSLKLNTLVQGYAGVSYNLCEALLKLIDAAIYPIIPKYGSDGANGDHIPLAHLALPLIGEGMVRYHNKEMPAKQALKAAGLKPIRLEEKEAIGLITGTQAMLAVGSLALAKARRLCVKADKVTALTYEGLNASPDALHPFIHEIRQQRGQIDSARLILDELEGSSLLSSKQHVRIEEPYSLRCAPQIHGPSREAIDYAIQVIEKELNATTDNPLVFCELEKILSGGNFHGQPLAMAYDIAAIALAELAIVSNRRLEVMLNPQLSRLPEFLTMHEGMNSGYQAGQSLSGALISEIKLLANPACLISVPENAGIDDCVSMGMTSADKLKKIVEHVTVILAIELMAAAQAVDLQHVKQLGKGTATTYQALRKEIPKLIHDRILSQEITKAVEVIEHI